MSIALVIGSAALIDSETCRRFSAEGFDIVGSDNDLRAEPFDVPASTIVADFIRLIFRKRPPIPGQMKYSRAELLLELRTGGPAS